MRIVLNASGAKTVRVLVGPDRIPIPGWPPDPDPDPDPDPGEEVMLFIVDSGYPASSGENEGDKYLDTLTGNLYEWDGFGWGLVFSFPTLASVPRFLVGAGAPPDDGDPDEPTALRPDTSPAQPGDCYLDATTGEIYTAVIAPPIQWDLAYSPN